MGGFQKVASSSDAPGTPARLVSILLAGLSVGANTPAANPAGVDGAVLTWAVPTTNVDGSALTDLIGFNVYHGSSPATMMMAVTLGATARTYADSNLTPTVWYWYVTAVNAVGTESSPSAIVSKTIVALAPPAATTPAPPPAPAPVAGASGSDDVPGSSAALPAQPRGATRRSQSLQRTLCKPWGTVGCFR